MTLRVIILLLSFFGSQPGRSSESARLDAVGLYGTLTGQIHWSHDPSTEEPVVEAHISFRPDRSTPICLAIRFVQTAKVEVSGGKDYLWPAAENARTATMTIANPGLGIDGGFYIDHFGFRCVPKGGCSPYFRDHFPNPATSQDGAYLPGIRQQAASLSDYPFGWSTISKIRLEACARCLPSGQFLGCVHWGAYWPSIGERTVLTPKFQQEPSETFKASFRQFQQFYKN